MQHSTKRAKLLYRKSRSYFMPTMQIDGLKINFERDGSGPPVVLVHGHGGSLHFFDNLAGHLKKHYTVIRYDQRGYGLTEKPLDPPYSTELWANDLHGFLTKLGIGRAIVGGHSMGGRVCVTFAGNHPSMATGLMTFNTTWFGSSPMAAEEMEKNFSRVEKEGMTAVLGYSRSYKSISREFQAVETKARQGLLKNDPKSYALGMKAVARDFRDQSRDSILSKVECSTLILNGDRDSAPLEGAIKMHKGIKNSRLAVIPGSGHYSLLEKEKICAAVILDFLHEVISA